MNTGIGRRQLLLATAACAAPHARAATETEAPGGAALVGITLAHLLDMASGQAWNEGVASYGTRADDETRLYDDGQPARYILDRPLVAAPGTVWNYNGGCTALLAKVLRRRSGRSLLELAGRDLFEPLGITRRTWRSGSHGQPLANAGLRLTPPDLLTLGRLVLAGGLWQGRQVVPAAWVVAVLQPRIATGPGAECPAVRPPVVGRQGNVQRQGTALDRWHRQRRAAPFRAPRAGPGRGDDGRAIQQHHHRGGPDAPFQADRGGAVNSPPAPCRHMTRAWRGASHPAAACALRLRSWPGPSASNPCWWPCQTCRRSARC